jgi:nitric oxide reductase large subunit
MSRFQYLHKSKLRRFHVSNPTIWLFAAIIMLLAVIAMNITVIAMISSKQVKSRLAFHDPIYNADGLRVTPSGLVAECGMSPREALKNGCIFDVMTFKFIPPACYD